MLLVVLLFPVVVCVQGRRGKHIATLQTRKSPPFLFFSADATSFLFLSLSLSHSLFYIHVSSPVYSLLALFPSVVVLGEVNSGLVRNNNVKGFTALSVTAALVLA